VCECSSLLSDLHICVSDGRSQRLDHLATEVPRRRREAQRRDREKEERSMRGRNRASQGGTGGLAGIPLPPPTVCLSVLLLVHESRRAELDLVVWAKCLRESSLVVVISVLGRVIDGSDIDEDGQLLQHGGVARANDAGAAELGSLQQHVAGEGLVHVETGRTHTHTQRETGRRSR
jgi:hypothetical protein